MQETGGKSRAKYSAWAGDTDLEVLRILAVTLHLLDSKSKPFSTGFSIFYIWKTQVDKTSLLRHMLAGHSRTKKLQC